MKHKYNKNYLVLALVAFLVAGLYFAGFARWLAFIFILFATICLAYEDKFEDIENKIEDLGDRVKNLEVGEE